MSEKKEKTNGFIKEQEHVVHMWEPLAFEVKKGYNYLRNNPLSRLASILLKTAAIPILTIFDHIVLGSRIEGWENLRSIQNTGAITICNHVHVMDCTLVAQALWKERTYFITLASNFKIPLVRHLVRLLGGVPLTADVQTTAELFREMGKALKKKACVQIYPEGVLIPYCNTLRSFKRGAFYLAEENNVPVLPMVITFHKPHGIRSLYKKKPCLHLHILPALWPDPALPKREQIMDLQERCYKSMNHIIKTKEKQNHVRQKSNRTSQCTGK